MKTIIIAVLSMCSFVFAQTDSRAISDQTEELPNLMKHMFEQGFLCGRELGAEKIHNLPNVLGLVQYPEDNDSLNALFGCVFKKKGIVNENSDIDEHKLEDYILDIASAAGTTSPYYRQALKGMTEECKKMKGDDPGHTAVKIQNCIVRYSTDRNLRK